MEELREQILLSLSEKNAFCLQLQITVLVLFGYLFVLNEKIMNKKNDVGASLSMHDDNEI